MIKKIIARAHLLLLAGIIFPVALHAVGTKDDAKALVSRAIAFYKANGKAAAFSEISNPAGMFVKGDLFIFVYDLNGVCVASGTDAGIIYKNMSAAVDSDGKFYVREWIEIARNKGNGWMNYKFANSSTYRIEKKTAYVEKIDSYIFGCSAYQ